MTTNEVYRKIVEISERTLNPRTPIPINSLTHELNLHERTLETALNQLLDMRVIKYHEVSRKSVRLTFLGKSACL